MNRKEAQTNKTDSKEEQIKKSFENVRYVSN